VTDARLPGRFLNLPRFDELSDCAMRVFIGSLMWSAEQGTDGELPRRYLRLFHPEGEKPSAIAELISAGLWLPTESGFIMPEWSTNLGQSTAEQVEAYREANRRRSKRYRDSKRRSESTAIVQPQGAAAMGHVPRDVTRGVGEGGGEGEGTASERNSESLNMSPLARAATADWARVQQVSSI